VKKAMKGELALLQKVQALQGELLSVVSGQTFEGTLEEESHLVSMGKKMFLMVGGIAVQKYGMELEKQQEILSNLADMMIEIFAMESALLRFIFMKHLTAWKFMPSNPYQRWKKEICCGPSCPY
jgi:hypothetical protein